MPLSSYSAGDDGSHDASQPDRRAQARAVPAALNERVELPLVSGSSADSAPAGTLTTAEIEFVEQNTWDYQPSANYATVERIRLIEDNSFDYVSPVTTEQIRFLEENTWDYQGRAQPAGQASAVFLSIEEFRFLEGYVWEFQGHLIPPAGNGATDY